MLRSHTVTAMTSDFSPSFRSSARTKTPWLQNMRSGGCDGSAVNSPGLRRNDKYANSGYKEGMNKALSRRLSQPQFADPMQEALLSLLVAANTLNDLMDELCERHSITRPQYNVLRILRGI